MEVGVVEEVVEVGVVEEVEEVAEAALGGQATEFWIDALSGDCGAIAVETRCS